MYMYIVLDYMYNVRCTSSILRYMYITCNLPLFVYRRLAQMDEVFCKTKAARKLEYQLALDDQVRRRGW